MTNETKESLREEFMSEFTKNNPKEAIFYKSLLADWWLEKLDQALKSQREEIVKKVEELPCRGEAVFNDGTNDIGLSRSEVLAIIK